jgi:hypothetical protein
MPNSCTICDNPRHEFIDRLIRNERSLLSISKEVGVSYDALRRHTKNEHVARFARPTVVPPSPVAAPTGERMVAVFSDEEVALHELVEADVAAVLASITGVTLDEARECFLGSVDGHSCAACAVVELAEFDALDLAVNALRWNVTPPAPGTWITLAEAQRLDAAAS